MQQLIILLVISSPSTCFGGLYAHRQEVRLLFHCLSFSVLLWLLWCWRVGWQAVCTMWSRLLALFTVWSVFVFVEAAGVDPEATCGTKLVTFLMVWFFTWYFTLLYRFSQHVAHNLGYSWSLVWCVAVGYASRVEGCCSTCNIPQPGRITYSHAPDQRPTITKVMCHMQWTSV